MPRGKYVNHKGRSRHFTSPEELQQESDSEEESESGNEEDDAKAAGGSTETSKGGAGAKPKRRVGKMPTSSEESDEDSDEEVDRDAKKGVASLIEIDNPNRVAKKATQKVSNLSTKEPVKPELSRKEREQLEKQKARVRYEKLHAEGKTSEARSDLARLALIRQQREEAAAKRQQEADAKKKAEEK